MALQRRSQALTTKARGKFMLLKLPSREWTHRQRWRTHARPQFNELQAVRGSLDRSKQHLKMHFTSFQALKSID